MLDCEIENKIQLKKWAKWTQINLLNFDHKIKITL